MADINIGLGVTGVDSFSRDLKSAQATVKNLDAQLKLADKTYKNTGNQEQYLEDKTKLLQQRFAAQQVVVEEMTRTLKNMADNGIDKTSASYLQMQTRVTNAETALQQMKSELNGVNQKANEATNSADELSDSLSKIEENTRFTANVTGFESIINIAGSVIGAVSNMATRVCEEIKRATSWADDLQTRATRYELDINTVQQMDYVADKFDADADTIIKAQRKIGNNAKYGGKEVMEAFGHLGIALTDETGKLRDANDLMWEAGAALINYAQTNGETEADAMAQKIFGKGFDELLPLFIHQREEYEQAMAEAPIMTEEEVKNLNDANDAIEEMEKKLDLIVKQGIAALSPEITEIANALADMMSEISEYIKTPEGQKLFEDLGNIAADITSILLNLGQITIPLVMPVIEGLIGVVKDVVGWIDEAIDKLELFLGLRDETADETYNRLVNEQRLTYGLSSVNLTDEEIKNVVMTQIKTAMPDINESNITPEMMIETITSDAFTSALAEYVSTITDGLDYEANKKISQNSEKVPYEIADNGVVIDKQTGIIANTMTYANAGDMQYQHFWEREKYNSEQFQALQELYNATKAMNRWIESGIEQGIIRTPSEYTPLNKAFENARGKFDNTYSFDVADDIIAYLVKTDKSFSDIYGIANLPNPFEVMGNPFNSLNNLVPNPANTSFILPPSAQTQNEPITVEAVKEIANESATAAATTASREAVEAMLARKNVLMKFENHVTVDLDGQQMGSQMYETFDKMFAVDIGGDS